MRICHKIGRNLVKEIRLTPMGHGVVCANVVNIDNYSVEYLPIAGIFREIRCQIRIKSPGIDKSQAPMWPCSAIKARMLHTLAA